MPSKVFTPGLVDGGRDSWFGPWPPGGLTDEGGKPLERRSES